MGANARSKTLLVLGVIAMAAVLAVVLVRGKGSTESRPESERTASGADLAARSSVRSEPAPRPGLAVPGDGSAADLAELPQAEVPIDTENEHPVDLEHLRSQLPDNLYWQLGVPTDDPQVLQKRADDERRWNELYGKVLSSTASEEEVHRYYEYRRQLSEDYIEFANLVLETYGDRLPDPERGAYELSIELHSARLAEIPRQVEDALARRTAYEQRKQEWQQSR